jgi:hypothetical protein
MLGFWWARPCLIISFSKEFYVDPGPVSRFTE